MSQRLAFPNRRHHITQKVKIAGQRTLYLSVLDDEYPAEIFIRLKGNYCSSELIGLYDVNGSEGVRQKVQLTYSLGPRGGKRPWFACPTCRRRVGVLYHANGLPFRCRTCC